MKPVTITEAIEVFVGGFSFTRSFTYPYLAERLEEGVWVVRDAERKKGDYRNEEYVGFGINPARFDAIAQKHTRGKYVICAITPLNPPASGGKLSPSPRAGRAGEGSLQHLKTSFKSLGYRLTATEALMTHNLEKIEPVESPARIVRITTPEEAQLFAKVTRSKQILKVDLQQEPPSMRQYMVLIDEKPVGWVGSIPVGECAWCSSMFVKPEYRRRGIAKALMTRMLLDDRAVGAKANVLLASHAGSKLYPTVGYKQIGELFVFVKTKQRT